MWPKVSVSLIKKQIRCMQENFHASKSFLKDIFPEESKYDIDVSKARSTLDLDLSKFGRPCIPSAAYQVPKSLSFWFLRRIYTFLSYMSVVAILVM